MYDKIKQVLDILASEEILSLEKLHKVLDKNVMDQILQVLQSYNIIRLENNFIILDKEVERFIDQINNLIEVFQNILSICTSLSIINQRVDKDKFVQGELVLLSECSRICKDILFQSLGKLTFLSIILTSLSEIDYYRKISFVFNIYFSYLIQSLISRLIQDNKILSKFGISCVEDLSSNMGFDLKNIVEFIENNSIMIAKIQDILNEILNKFKSKLDELIKA